MKKELVIFGIIVGLLGFSACVPAKQFKDLQNDYEALQQENGRLSDNLTNCQDQLAAEKEAHDRLRAKQDQLQAEQTQLRQKKTLLQQKLDQLQKSYDALEKQSSSALAENSKQNRELLAKIEAKQEKLVAEKARLGKLQKDLESRGKRIDQLEGIIAAKENQMKELKDNISAALTDFEGKGLTVHRKNGKVYVSMENKLLFSSGSWAVNAQGRTAIEELGKVLAQNPDIHVLIEGHTDNVPYHGHGQLSDNWDLSTKRATAVVRILLENNSIDPKQLTAAGRSKFAPVAGNSKASGRAKNRRIEVILTPEWDKLSALLEEKE